MAFDGQQLDDSGLIAGADLSAAQFQIVKLSAAKTVILCAAATDKPIGILQNTPKSGQAASVCWNGLSKVVVGATVAFGDTVGTDTNGRAVTYVAGTDTTKYGVGQVIEPGAAALGLATVFVNITNGRLA
jgi:hypothetical protein